MLFQTIIQISREKFIWNVKISPTVLLEIIRFRQTFFCPFNINGANFLRQQGTLAKSITVQCRKFSQVFLIPSAFKKAFLPVYYYSIDKLLF